jgi:hypothetical protein
LLSNDQSCCVSEAKPNPYIYVRLFDPWSFIPTGYFIQVGKDNLPKNWEFQGFPFKSGNKITIHSIQNSSNVPFAGICFQVLTNQPFDQIDFFQTDKNTDGSDAFVLSSVEIYGTLKKQEQ